MATCWMGAAGTGAIGTGAALAVMTERARGGGAATATTVLDGTVLDGAAGGVAAAYMVSVTRREGWMPSICGEIIAT